MAARRENRGPGRPAAERSADVRAALLAAARARIIEVGYAAASIKDIAAAAGVNAAMISYYFGGKAALAEAAFRDAIEPLRRQFAALDTAARGNAGGPGADVWSFLRTYMQTLAENPAVPRLIVREVLPENGVFRRIFFDEIVGRGAAALPVALTAEQRRGAVSSAVDPVFATVSIVSLVVFPFLAAPLLNGSFRLDLEDAETFERFAAHTFDLLAHGLLANPGAET